MDLWDERPLQDNDNKWIYQPPRNEQYVEKKPNVHVVTKKLREDNAFTVVESMQSIGWPIEAMNRIVSLQLVCKMLPRLLIKLREPGKIRKVWIEEFKIYSDIRNISNKI